MRTYDSRRSGRRFRLGLLIYILIFFAALIAGLRVLWSFLEKYEGSRPDNIIDGYIDTLDADHIKDLSSNFIKSLDEKLCSEEDALEVITESCFSGKLGCKLAKISDDGSIHTYAILNDGKKIGTVDTLTTAGKEMLDWDTIEITSEHYEFSHLLRENSITVPSFWSVAFNGNKLDAKYITEKDIPIDFLENFYSHDEFDFPYLVTYSVSNYIGEKDFTVYDASGAEVQIPESREFDEILYTDNCSEKEKSDLLEFYSDFAARYVRFLSNADKANNVNCRKLLELVAEDSSLVQRFLEARAGLVYSQSVRDVISDIHIDSVMRIEDGVYAMNCGYSVTTTNTKNYEALTENTMTMIVKTVNGELKAYAMSTNASAA